MSEKRKNIIAIKASDEEKEEFEKTWKENGYTKGAQYIIDAINQKAGKIIFSTRKHADYDHKAPARRAREEAEKQGIIYKTEDQKNG